MCTSRLPHTWKHRVKRKCLPTLPILSHGRLKIRPSKTGFGKSNTFPFKKDILSETHTLFHLGSFVLKNITLIITACKRLSLPFSIVCVCGGPQRPEESNMSPQLESPDKGAGPKLRSSGKRSSLNHLVTSPAPRCCLFYQAFL